MRVVEIFDSIDGEGIFAGSLATFIRLAGCNLRCSYCDTPYALKMDDGEEMEVSDIVKACQNLGNRHVTLTGGEPLIHYGVKYLVNQLADNGFIVNIETNGSIPIAPYIRDNVVITMDYKTSSSGEKDKMKLENLAFLRETDVLKIVCDDSDFDEIWRLLAKSKVKSYVYLSPVFGKIEPQSLVSMLKTMRDIGIDTEKFRVQVQLHKVIWPPEKRGV